jgi:hypothetical protein
MTLLFLQLVLLNLGIAIMEGAYKDNLANQKAQENDALFSLNMELDSYCFWNRFKPLDVDHDHDDHIVWLAYKEKEDEN